MFRQSLSCFTRRDGSKTYRLVNGPDIRRVHHTGRKIPTGSSRTARETFSDRLRLDERLVPVIRRERGDGAGNRAQ